MAGRWFIVIPPEGGARTVGLQASRALDDPGTGIASKKLDSLSYLNAFKSLLKTPADEMIVDLFNQALVVSCLDFETTHLLVPALAPVTAFTLRLLRKQGVRTIHWFFEDFTRAAYWTEVIDSYDCFCAIQRGPVEAACRERGVRYLFLPTAGTRPCVERVPPLSDRSRDLVFVGIPSPYRVQILEYLAANGIRLAIAGYGWDKYKGMLAASIVDGRWIEGEALGRLLSDSRIALNLSVQDPVATLPDTHISPRLFDAALHGCLLCTEDVPLLKESAPDLAIHVFCGRETALTRTMELLSSIGGHEEECEINRRNVIAHHLYKNRIQALLAAAAPPAH